MPAYAAQDDGKQQDRVPKSQVGIHAHMAISACNLLSSSSSSSSATTGVLVLTRDELAQPGSLVGWPGPLPTYSPRSTPLEDGRP